MFRIKGQIQTSHLSNLQAYRPKSHFRDNGQSNTFILQNTKPNRFTYHVCNKGCQGTSSIFPFIKLRDKGHFNTFILPNLKPNRFKYYVLNQGTSSTFILIKIVTIQAKISFSRQGTFQYFHFTEYETKQDHISCFASRDKFKLPIYQSCRQIDQNLIFATTSFQYFHFTEYKTKQVHISCFA